MTDTTPPANLTAAEVAQWEAACAATPGPCRIMHDSNELYVLFDDYFPCDCWVKITGSLRESVSKHIAANKPDTVRARLREISELRGALREILAIDKKAEIGPETDYEFGWNEALIRCQEIAEEAINAKT